MLYHVYINFITLYLLFVYFSLTSRLSHVYFSLTSRYKF